MEITTPSNSDFAKNGLLSGLRWTGAGQFAAQAISLVVTIVLARLLAPEDFGLIAMASVFTAFLASLQNFGTGDIIVQKKELSPELFSSLFFLNGVTGIFFWTGLTLSSPYLAQFLNNVEVEPVIQLLSVSIVISSLGMAHQSALIREMDFSHLVRIEFLATAVYGVTGILLAYLGWKVWAIVGAVIVRATVSTILLWTFSSWRIRLCFHWHEIKKVGRFSLNMTGAKFIGFLHARSADLIVGRFLGAAPLGFYSMAWTLNQYALAVITKMLMRVLFPALARIQDNNEALRNLFFRACGGIALLTFPMMLGLASLAEPFILVVLGEKWAPIVPLLIIFAPVGMFQSIASPTGRIYVVKNRTDLYFWWTCGSTAIIVGSFFCGLPWGLVGVASAYTLVMVPLTYLSFALSLRLINASFMELMLSLWPYTLGSVLMSGGVLVCRAWLETLGFGPHMVLVLCIPLGCLIYGMIMIIFRPKGLEDFLKILGGTNGTLSRWLSAGNREVRRSA